MQEFSGRVAVVTGGASGIGFGLATSFAAEGMKIVLGDIEVAALADAVGKLEASGAEVLGVRTDVSDGAQVQALADAAVERFGAIHIACNNAGVAAGGLSWEVPVDTWEWVFGANLWGVIHGVQSFVPTMIQRGRSGLVINTGSKQGITTPPGDPAYNVSKAGVKTFTEALQHELRNTQGCRINAHLLIPGFVFTELTANGRTDKPSSAWTPEQTIDFMLERLEADDFYVLCPDNDVPRSLDERRILWAAGDLVENRPPLSRWHPDHAKAFDDFSRGR